MFSFHLFILFFWLCWVFLVAHGLCLHVVSRDFFAVAVCGLLIAVPSLFAEHGLWSAGSVVVTLGD